MAIVDSTNPQQAMQCDLCGANFKRPLKLTHDSFGDKWEDVSITVRPSIGEPGSFGFKPYIKVEHACEECRKSFIESVRSIIAKMKSIPPTDNPRSTFST